MGWGTGSQGRGGTCDGVEGLWGRGLGRQGGGGARKKGQVEIMKHLR